MMRPDERHSRIVLAAALRLAARFGPMVLLFDRLSAAARGGRVRRFVKALTGMTFVGFGITLATLRA